jgi:hypothetical protein
MGRAGASARREYERRRDRDRRRLREHRPRALLVVLATPPVVFGLVLLSAWLMNRWTSSALAGSGPAPNVFDGSTTMLLAVMLAATATLRVATDVWGPRRSTESWRKGYQGELLTERHLAALPDRFVVLHDLRLPGRRENVDHLVIGPTGVFTVETKHYSSPVTIRRGVARCAGRRLDDVVEQARRQADAVAAVLGTSVVPLVCVHGAGVEVSGLFASPVVAGVRFCSGRRLVRLVRSGSGRLDERAVAGLVSRAKAGLRPAVGEQPDLSPAAPSPANVPRAVPATVLTRRRCECGADQVLRRRRTDGQQFWGCRRFPACRNTSPA